MLEGGHSECSWRSARPFWSLHTHSRYSLGDAMPRVSDLVAHAAALGWPAVGLTDHGTVAGSVQLYKAGKKHGIKTLPGIELYLTADHLLRSKRSMHLTIAAYTEQGYRNLVGLSTLAARNFHMRPRLDFADLAGLAEDGGLRGLVAGTGCRSGPVVRTLLERGEAPAQRVVETLAGWFPRLYVELMNHGFDADGASDDQITGALYDIACGAGLPFIITSDSHYLKPEEQVAHDALKRLVTWSEDPDEGVFNGEGYYLPTATDLSAYFEPHILDEALVNLADLAEAAQPRIPELDDFVLKVPDVTIDGRPDKELAERVTEAMEAFLENVPQRKHRVYNERLQAELDVISDTGMAGYLLLVAWICEFMTDKGIWYGTRGSASGSLVCHLLDITQLDPVAWGIRMDRFLSGDRTSPPDIDVDIEHTRREEVLDALASRWEVRRICTYARYGMDDDEDSKGSLRVALFSTLKKRGIEKPSWDDVTAEERAMLADLSKRELLKSVGAHPAGVIVAADTPTVDSLPMTWIASSKSLVTAYDKDDVETLGFPKVDLLGLKTLTALRIACELLAPGRGKEFYTAIPNDDRSALRRIAKGNTTGMFQLEGGAQRRGCRDLQPKKTADIVAAQALFRPAAMKSGFTESYLRRRRKEEAVPEMHADIAAETKDTYGQAIYQEQIVGVLRRIGMGPLELTAMLKAVKASGKSGIEKARVAVAEALPAIRRLAEARGWSERDIEWLAGGLTDYGGGYSFNLGHAAAYGIIAYRSAYLAEHHSLAFWTGMLIAFTGAENGKGEDLEKLYLRACKEDGVLVLPAHVNSSGADYTPDDQLGAIRKGLLSIKGLGEGAAADLVSRAPFESLTDLAQRVTPKRVTCARKLLKGVSPAEAGGVVQALHEAGALEGLA